MDVLKLCTAYPICVLVASIHARIRCKSCSGGQIQEGSGVPLGPIEVLVIRDSCLQASMFFSTASSRPDRCLCPSFSMACHGEKTFRGVTVHVSVRIRWKRVR